MTSTDIISDKILKNSAGNEDIKKLNEKKIIHVDEGNGSFIKELCSCCRNDCITCTVASSIEKDCTCSETSSLDCTTHPSAEAQFMYHNPIHDSSKHSNCSESISSSKKSVKSFEHSKLSNAESQTDTENVSFEEMQSSSKDCSSHILKLTIPKRIQYHKLESTSLTEPLSHTFTYSGKYEYEWTLHSNQSNLKSLSESTAMDKSYSQLASTVSGTLAPTPVHGIPDSITKLSSSCVLPNLSTKMPPEFSSPPLSPITPITNTIMPENPASKRVRSKRSFERAAECSQYIFVAAHQISEAQEHEKKNELEEAVAKYREGVGTLLQGVQEVSGPSTVQSGSASSANLATSSIKHKKGEDEANVARREGVRRKTYQYLQRAEQLLAKLTWQAVGDGVVGMNIPSLGDKECVSGVGVSGLQCGMDVLRQYRVLGVTGGATALWSHHRCSCCCCGEAEAGVIIAQLPQSNHTVAIKVIRKSSNGRNGSSAAPINNATNIIPRGVPHMVPVICYHETDSAIYLVMKYIRGGKLWDHITKYVTQLSPPANPAVKESANPATSDPEEGAATRDVSAHRTNVYSGRRLLVVDTCQDALEYQQSGVKKPEEEVTGRTPCAVVDKGSNDTRVTVGESNVVKEMDDAIRKAGAQCKKVKKSDPEIPVEDLLQSVLEDKTTALSNMPAGSIGTNDLKDDRCCQKKKENSAQTQMPNKLKPTADVSSKKQKSLEVTQRSHEESLVSPLTHDAESSVNDVISYELEETLTLDETRLVSSRFTTETEGFVARSGMAHYAHLDTSSCASDTTMAADCWGDDTVAADTTIDGDCWDSESAGMKLEGIETQAVGSAGMTKPAAFDDSLCIAATISEMDGGKRIRSLCVLSERQTKTSPIACLGTAEIILGGGDLELFPGHFVSKSHSADDLTLNSISAHENVQHSTISTVNVIPFLPNILYDDTVVNDGKVSIMRIDQEDDNVSVGSDTLSGVSDDFSCSLSINHLSEDRKAAFAGPPSDPNLLSECAVSEGQKRPPNTPDSTFALLQQSDVGALHSLCQTTSADITLDVTMELSAITLHQHTDNSFLKDSVTAGLKHGSQKSVQPSDTRVAKLISLDGESCKKRSDKSTSSGSGGCVHSHPKTHTGSTSQPAKKLIKSNSDDVTVEKDGKKVEEERCPSEPASISSVTLPSFSASQVADRSGSEVASFDIEELIRNSRRLLQNVDVTLEQSKGKSSAHPIPSEDSSTSIDQSELPLDSVSVGFDTPDIPSNSTRCSNVSSDNQGHSKVMADNTYSSIPSIALDTSRHGLNPLLSSVNDNRTSMDKALRSPRHHPAVDSLAKVPQVEEQARPGEVSSGESFISCNDNQTSQESSGHRDGERAFLSLPRESMTSKEDSTNPSDVHTQIHLNAAADISEKAQYGLKSKMPVLERQAHVDKSDTSKSSLKKDIKESALKQLMKTIGITKLSNDSHSASNDSTSISGLTLNNSESAGDASINESLKQSASVRNQSADEDTDRLSSESTSGGLRYCANPLEANRTLTNLVGAAGMTKECPSRVRSALELQKASSPSAKRSEQAMSEPLYLIPQSQRELAKDNVESTCSGNDEIPSQAEKYSGGRGSAASSDYVTASIQAAESGLEKILLQQDRHDADVRVQTVGTLKTKTHRTHSLNSAIPGSESATESYSLHTCKSDLSADENDSNAGVTDSTNSTNTKCSTDVGTYTRTNTTGAIATGSTNTSSNGKQHGAGLSSYTPVTNTDTSFLQNNPRATSAKLPRDASSHSNCGNYKEKTSLKQHHKVSMLRQTPLSELLEKHWNRGDRDCERDRDDGGEDRRHLPEGLVRVWGAQVVTAIAALHQLGVVWGDFGPHNVLLDDGGSVTVTLETRWAVVDRDRPGRRRRECCAVHPGAGSHSCAAGGEPVSCVTASPSKEHRHNKQMKNATEGIKTKKKAQENDGVLIDSSAQSTSISSNKHSAAIKNAVSTKLATSTAATSKAFHYCSGATDALTHVCSPCCSVTRVPRGVGWSGGCGCGCCGACLGYVAPELRSPLCTATPASDWWSVGALLYHLLTGQSVRSQHPSGVTTHTELLLPQHLSQEAKLLLTQLLTAHPSERLGGGPSGAEEIRLHPFFMEAPWH